MNNLRVSSTGQGRGAGADRILQVRRILYLGALESGATSLYRFKTLQRLRQDVIPFNLSAFKFRNERMNWLAARFPIGPLISKVNHELLTAVRREEPEVVWFDKPVQFTPETIRCVKRSGAQTVNYNQDNPFGANRGSDWFQYYRTYRMHDLHCLFRDVDVPRYRARGLEYVRVQLSYDRDQHFPPPDNWSDTDRTREVSFIGSPFDDRPQFLRALIQQHSLPVVISGPRWHKVFSRDEMKRYTLGPGMLKDAEYRENIWRSKINLSFVTMFNEEDVAHKAFEIAACRGFLLALRTPGHQACFEEGKEAEFFSSIEECAEKINYYLAHPIEREEIASRGCDRARNSGYDNDTQLKRIFNRLEDLRDRA